MTSQKKLPQMLPFSWVKRGKLLHPSVSNMNKKILITEICQGPFI